MFNFSISIHTNINYLFTWVIILVLEVNKGKKKCNIQYIYTNIKIAEKKKPFVNCIFQVPAK